MSGLLDGTFGPQHCGSESDGGKKPSRRRGFEGADVTSAASRLINEVTSQSIIVSQAIDMEPDRRAVQVVLEFERPPWAQRKFTFGHPSWMLADFIERLRGVLPRLEALLVGLDDDRAYRQLGGKWSIAQNIGHLSDVEELWQERLDDLREGKKTYSPAVVARFQELAKRHQDRPVLETMKEFSSRRSRLIDALAQASPELQRAAAFHERLQVPMRLVDCAQFYAEHDDHHLIRIRRLRSMRPNANAGDERVTLPSG